MRASPVATLAAIALLLTPVHTAINPESDEGLYTLTPEQLKNEPQCTFLKPPPKQLTQDDVDSICSGPMASEEEARKAAARFAPVWVFHPAEKYFPVDAKEWYASAQLFNRSGGGRQFGPASDYNIARLYESDRRSDALETQYRVAEIWSKENIFASVNSTAPTTLAQGRSDFENNPPPVYFSLGQRFNCVGLECGPNATRTFGQRFRNTHTFNFFLAYGWNGCGNEQILAREPDGKEAYYDFQLCPFGVHEGDVEGVSVEVCGDLSQILTVRYSAHDYDTFHTCVPPASPAVVPNASESVRAWEQAHDQYDTGLEYFREGDCRFAGNASSDTELHPLVFVALETHATYPGQASGFIYKQIREVNDYLDRMLAVNLVDLIGPGKQLRSTEANLKYLRTNLTEYQPHVDALLQDPNYQSPDEFPIWHLFNGRMGGDHVPDVAKVEIQDPRCYSRIAKDWIECPSKNVYTKILDLITDTAGSLAEPVLDILRKSIVNDIQDAITAEGPVNLRHNSAFIRTLPNKSPFSDADLSSAICPVPLFFDLSFIPGIIQRLQGSDTANNSILGFLIVFFPLIIVCGLLFHCLKHRQRREAVKHKKAFRDGSETWCQCLSVGHIPIFDTIILIVSTAGCAVLCVGITLNVDLMKETLGDGLVPVLSQLQNFTIIFVVVAYFFMLVSVITSYITRHGLLMAWMEKSSKRLSLQILHSKNFLRLMYMWRWMVFIAMLLSGMFLSIAAIMFGIRLMINQGCQLFDDIDLIVVTQSCLNLQDFGLNQVCGDDIIDVCEQWLSDDVSVLVAGAVIFAVAAGLSLISTVEQYGALRLMQHFEQGAKQSKRQAALATLSERMREGALIRTRREELIETVLFERPYMTKDRSKIKSDSRDRLRLVVHRIHHLNRLTEGTEAAPAKNRRGAVVLSPPPGALGQDYLNLAADLHCDDSDSDEDVDLVGFGFDLQDGFTTPVGSPGGRRPTGNFQGALTVAATAFSDAGQQRRDSKLTDDLQADGSNGLHALNGRHASVQSAGPQASASPMWLSSDVADHRERASADV